MFLEMHEPREAELHLRDADALAPLLSPKLRQQWHDHYIAMCALWEFEAGNIAQAEKEVETANNPDYSACLRIRAKLCMVRQEFGKAVKLLRKYRAEEKKRGTLHRPDLLRAAIDYAEALYGDGKHAEAIAAFEEAHSIVVDFKMPSDAEWGKTLETWLPRVRAAQRAELAEAMTKEIGQILTTPSKAITILDKFKRHGGDKQD
jgi:tetratricopeptide (TPR) repeat protein